MAQVMRYTSPRGKEVFFDSWEKSFYDDFGNLQEDEDGYWVDLCPHHHNKYRGILGNSCAAGCSGEACCSVLGCTSHNAEWYCDFKKSEVEFITVGG